MMKRSLLIKIMRNKHFVFIPVIVLTLLYDIFLMGDIGSLIIVDDSFMYYIYSAQFTVSALSLSVLAIITSVLSDRYYGFTFKEILVMANEDEGISSVIIKNLMVVGITSFCLLFNGINTIFVLLLYTISSIILFSLISVECLLNKDYPLDSVKAYIENESFSVTDSIKIINSFRDLVKVGISDEMKKEYIALISSAFLKYEKTEQYSPNSKQIVRALQGLSKASIEEVGYIDTLKLLKGLYASMENDYEDDYVDILTSSFIELKYMNDKEFASSNINSSIRRIIENDEVSTDTREKIIRLYLRNLEENTLLNRKTKAGKIIQIIEQLSDMGYIDDGVKIMHTRLIFYIVKYIDLPSLEKDYFIEVIHYLFQKNIYSENKYFFEILKDLYLLIYSYSFKMTQNFNDDYMSEVQNYLESVKDNRYREKVDLNTLIKMNSDGVFKAIAEQSVNENEFDKYGVFERSYKVTNVVWEMNLYAEILICFYLLFNPRVHPKNFINIYEKWEEINPEKQKRILRSLIECIEVDNEQYRLSSNAESTMEELSSWHEMNKEVNSNLLKSLRDEFVLRSSQLIDEILEQGEILQPDISLEEVTSLVNCNINEQFGYATNEVAGELKVLSFGYRLYRNNFLTNEKLAESIYDGLLKYINKEIYDLWDEKRIKFNEEGIEEILDFLIEHDEYDSSTYRITSDYGFEQSVRERQCFISLKEKESEMSYNRQHPIRGNVVFDSNRVKMKIKRLIPHEKLNDEDVERLYESYLSMYEVGNGTYRIDNAIVSKTVALKSLKQNYSMVGYKIYVESNIEQDSGVLIRYDFD